MYLRASLHLITVVVLLGGCATNRSLPVASTDRHALTVTVASEEPPVVRGYELTRVSALLQSLLREDLASADLTRGGTVELRLLSDSYVLPGSIRSLRTDLQVSITWFAVDFRVMNASGQMVRTGHVVAEGPDPGSISSIQMYELSVAKDAATKIRRKLAQTHPHS